MSSHIKFSPLHTQNIAKGFRVCAFTYQDLPSSDEEHSQKLADTLLARFLRVPHSHQCAPMTVMAGMLLLRMQDVMSCPG